MAEMNLQFDDALVPRILDAFAARYGWEQGNPQHGTKAAFAKKIVIRFVRDTVIQHEAQLAAEAAMMTATTTAEAQIIVT